MAHDAEDETLPFEVEIERLPAWVHLSSGAVVLVGVLVAAKLAPMLALLPFLVVSSLGRRFASSAKHVEVHHDGLVLGRQSLPKSAIHDVSLDDDESEPRVTVAYGDAIDLAILHFVNREQARRFAGAIAGPVVVAGHRPKPVDALSSLRFLALALGFLGTGSWLALILVALFGMGAFAFVRAKQVIARADGFEVRSAFGTRSIPYVDVKSVDRESGVVSLAGDRQVSVPRGSLRDTMLAAPAWLERSRARVLERIDSGAKRERKTDAAG